MNPSTELIRSEAPTPQLAPKPSIPKSAASPAKARGVSPIMVRPALSKLRGSTDANVKSARGLDRSLQLIGGRDGFDPDQIDPAFDQPLDLLGKAGDRIRALKLAKRRQNFSGRSDRPGDQHAAAGLVRHLPGQLRRAAVQRSDLIIEAMELKPVPGAAEGVGQEQVAARLDKGLMQGLHPVRMLEQPGLGRLTALQPHGEQVGPGRTIGQQK